MSQPSQASRERAIALCCQQLRNDPAPNVRSRAAKALGLIGRNSETAKLALFLAAEQDPNDDVRASSIDAIAQLYKEPLPTPSIDVLIQLTQLLQTMSEQPKVQMNFNAPVTGAAGNVEGDFIVQAQEQDFAAALTEVRQLLETLQQKYPTATAADAPIIMRAELESMQANQPQQWAMVKRNLLNRDRWLKGGKAAVIEVTKDLAEKNTLVKGAIAFLEAFSEEVEIAG